MRINIVNYSLVNILIFYKQPIGIQKYRPFTSSSKEMSRSAIAVDLLMKHLFSRSIRYQDQIREPNELNKKI